MMTEMVMWVMLPFVMFILGWFLGAKEKKKNDHGILITGDDVNGDPHWTLDLHLTPEEVDKKKHIQLRVIPRETGQ